MLLRLQFFERQLLSGFEWRQLVLQFLVFFVFAFLRFFVDSEETVKLKHGSGHAEPVRFAPAFGVDVNRGLIEHSGIDLRRNKPLPDQFVDLVFIFF
jgi:hypothetical protein